MKTVRSIADLRAATGGANRCALVPTMGNLHEGHLSLVRLARDAIARGQAAGPIVTSIFVNRLQFGPNDDFDQYPRTFEADCARLEASGCDIVFAPTERDLYPEPQRYTVTPDPAIAEILEGAFRPGFFTGVCTVVLKLFLAAQPAVAVFGKKDYQQLMVVRRMVDQFALPIDIIGAETARDRDGLALSSRNGYLDIEQRSRAVQLSAALQGLIAAWKRDPGAREALEREAAATLTAAGWKPDYLVIRRRRDLQPPDLAGAAATGTGATVTAATGTAATGNGPLVALGAARIGTTRLIDNLEFD